ncbi:UNVERIFIED_CONTAM: hypothetical protein FKN15_061704 [Acipenser sinensis]
MSNGSEVDSEDFDTSDIDANLSLRDYDEEDWSQEHYKLYKQKSMQLLYRSYRLGYLVSADPREATAAAADPRESTAAAAADPPEVTAAAAADPREAMAAAAADPREATAAADAREAMAAAADPREGNSGGEPLAIEAGAGAPLLPCPLCPAGNKKQSQAMRSWHPWAPWRRQLELHFSLIPCSWWISRRCGATGSPRRCGATGSPRRCGATGNLGRSEAGILGRSKAGILRQCVAGQEQFFP